MAVGMPNKKEPFTISPVDGVYDIAVLGAGPAGLTAAIFGTRAGLSVLVLGSESGLLSETPRLDNFPSWAVDSSNNSNNDKEMGGAGWLAATKEQATALGASFAQAGLLVSKLTMQEQEFVLEVGTPSSPRPAIRAWSVVVATGAVPRRLRLPQEDVLWGKSLHSCAICDGSLYADKHVIVVGGGDAAVDAAILLARHARKVVVVHRRDEFRASNQMSLTVMKQTANIDIMTPYAVDRWEGQPQLTGAWLKNKNDGTTQHIPCDGAFVMIGATPNTEWLKGSAVDLNKEGLVQLMDGAATRTSLPGVFAAGEVVDTVYRQAVTAAASGAQAAIDAERWLRQTKGVVKRQVVAPALLETHPIRRKGIVSPIATTEVGCDLSSVNCIESIIKKYPVVVVSKTYCPSCRKALEALTIEGVTNPYIIDLTALGSKASKIQDVLQKMTGRRTVPNVFVGGDSIGGGDETTGMQRQGTLGHLLRKVGAI